ncbi:Ig-like domain-containing protein [Glycomyces sp. MUSA5-2]|jgi:hypothetical protein|uniref:Ig-like domain-containing protein n=1 Tax=Glycomyces sp. MUSA5-2 TaxID=2053002 RepID=UPI00300A9B31
MLKKLTAPLAVGALILAGCGGTDPGGDGPSVSIEQPAEGDELTAPFTVVVESSEELGTTESGNHHVHLYFDGNDGTYEVIESGNGEEYEVSADSPVLEGLEPGEHTLNVSLRNADHSAAGAEDEVTVTIGDGTGGGGGDEDEDDGGGYGY